MIPLAHDFTDETVLVFGGGSVGARKARHFAVEADVVVVSPAFADADFGDAELVRAAPESGEIAAWVERVDPVLVVAATDDVAINEAAAAAARERGALCNRADRSAAASVGDSEDAETAGEGVVTASEGVETVGAGEGEVASPAADGASARRPVDDVAVPATVRDDPVVVSVSTGGTSPALARVLRQRVEDEIDGAGAMAEVTGALRERLQEKGVPAAERRRALRGVVRSSQLWTDLRAPNANVDQITEELVTEVLQDT